MKDLKFVFFGTPDVAADTLELLKLRGYVPQLVITAPDRPVGRHFTMTPCATKVWADANRIPTLQPEKITSEIIADLANSPWDVFVVVAYGKILPQALIDIPKLATINIHYSVLPKYRGATPVESAILAGDTETGVTVQKMVFKLDAGPILASERVAIEPIDTTPSLRGKLIPIGADLVADLLDDVVSGKSEAFAGPIPQDETQATHFGKTKKEDGLVNPDHDDQEIMWRKYRAYQPWPGLYFIHEGKRMKIKQAKFENGRFIIETVVPEGKAEVAWNR